MTNEQIKARYNRAYDFWVHCPESQVEAAKKELDFWRHKWINN